MGDYKILRVSEQEPRTSESVKYGTTYYIGVIVDGHNKPLSVGKKKPDALHVGDVLTGTIIPTEYASDNFKADYNLPTIQSNHPLKGESPEKQDSIMRMNALTNAITYNTAIPKETLSNLTNVLVDADKLYGWLKGGSQGSVPFTTKTSTSATNDGETPAAPSAYDQLEKTANKLRPEEPPVEVYEPEGEIDLDGIPF